MEALDDLDAAVLNELGYAMARAQLLELAMVKLLEAQQQDMSVPLDDRWDEIMGWMEQTAGRLARGLHVPETVAADLKAIVGRRNRVAHRSWVDYQAARAKGQGETAAAEWTWWLKEQASFFGRAYNAVIAIVHRARTAEEVVPPAEIEQLWRQHLPEPVGVL